MSLKALPSSATPQHRHINKQLVSTQPEPASQARVDPLPVKDKKFDKSPTPKRGNQAREELIHGQNTYPWWRSSAGNAQSRRRTPWPVPQTATPDRLLLGLTARVSRGAQRRTWRSWETGRRRRHRLYSQFSWRTEAWKPWLDLPWRGRQREAPLYTSPQGAAHQMKPVRWGDGKWRRGWGWWSAADDGREMRDGEGDEGWRRIESVTQTLVMALVRGEAVMAMATAVPPAGRRYRRHRDQRPPRSMRNTTGKRRRDFYTYTSLKQVNFEYNT